MGFVDARSGRNPAGHGGGPEGDAAKAAVFETTTAPTRHLAKGRPLEKCARCFRTRRFISLATSLARKPGS